MIQEEINVKRFRFITGFIVGAILFSGITAAAVTYVATPAAFKVYVNGEEFKPTTGEVLVVDGRSYLPLLDMGNALGVPVWWNAELGRAEVGKAKPASNATQEDTLLVGNYRIPITHYNGKDYIKLRTICDIWSELGGGDTSEDTPVVGERPPKRESPIAYYRLEIIDGQLIITFLRARPTAHTYYWYDNLDEYYYICTISSDYTMIQDVNHIEVSILKELRLLEAIENFDNINAHYAPPPIKEEDPVDDTAYNEFKAVWNITFDRRTPYYEALYNAYPSGNTSSFRDTWSKWLKSDKDTLLEFCKRLARETRLSLGDDANTYTVAISYKYNGIELGYAFAYPGDGYYNVKGSELGSLTPNPFME